MIRESAAFRRMAVLALVAVLLASVVPTISRVMASAASKGGPILMEMCTVAGIKLMDVAPFLDEGDPRPAEPAPPMAPVCDYCVLATPVLVVLALLLALLAWAPGAPAARVFSAASKPLRNLRGLGSQAPPCLL